MSAISIQEITIGLNKYNTERLDTRLKFGVNDKDQIRSYNYKI